MGRLLAVSVLLGAGAVFAQKLNPVQWSMYYRCDRRPLRVRCVNARLVAKLDPGWHIYSLSLLPARARPRGRPGGRRGAQAVARECLEREDEEAMRALDACAPPGLGVPARGEGGRSSASASYSTARGSRARAPVRSSAGSPPTRTIPRRAMP